MKHITLKRSSNAFERPLKGLPKKDNLIEEESHPNWPCEAYSSWRHIFSSAGRERPAPSESCAANQAGCGRRPGGLGGRGSRKSKVWKTEGRPGSASNGSFCHVWAYFILGNSGEALGGSYENVYFPRSPTLEFHHVRKNKKNIRLKQCWLFWCIWT